MEVKLIHTCPPLLTNTYLFDCGNSLAVVDPGSNAEKIVSIAERIGKPIRFILLTHAHWDHVGAVSTLQKQGAKVYVHKTELKIIANFVPDFLIEDGSMLTLDEVTVQVVHTPGHTAGGVCYIIGDTMFSGDTLFYLEIGRCDLPTGNFDTMKKTLQKLFALKNNYRILPGHGKETTLNFERLNNPYREG